MLFMCKFGQKQQICYRVFLALKYISCFVLHQLIYLVIGRVIRAFGEGLVLPLTLPPPVSTLAILAHIFIHTYNHR